MIWLNLTPYKKSKHFIPIYSNKGCLYICITANTKLTWLSYYGLLWDTVAGSDTVAYVNVQLIKQKEHHTYFTVNAAALGGH